MIKSAKSCLSVALGILILWIPSNVVNTQGHPTVDAPVSYRPAAGAGNIPMFFEENVGQTDDRVRFIGRGQAYSVLVTNSEAVFKLAPAGSVKRSGDVRMQWIGANAQPRVVADLPLPGKCNYLIGNDPSAWKTNIPTWGKVRHEEVYPGVDLEFHGKGELIEYDVVVKPGGDPDNVRLRFTGAERISIDEVSGDLVLNVEGGEIRHQKASVYQPTSAGRRPVGARFAVTPDGDVAVELGDYDPTQTVVIDPVVTFVQFVGGSQSEDVVTGIDVDASGGMYVSGRTRSFDLSPLLLSYDATFNGLVDAFVMKFDSATGSIVYSSYLGSPGNDSGYNIAVDSQGAAYVTGFTDSAMFPTTPGAYRQTYSGNTDGFICKLAPDGASLEYSTLFGGAGSDTPFDITVDGTGLATVVGQTTSSDLETMPGAFDPILNGSSDGFALKLNATGGALVQATYLGGTGPDLTRAGRMTVDGDLVLVGETSSADFPTSAGVFDITLDGNQPEGFITRLSASLNTVTYSTFIGRAGDDRVFDLAVSGTGQVSFVGWTSSTDLPVTPNAPQPMFGGGGERDGMVGRISADGTVMEFLTYLGGPELDFCEAMALDSNGAVYVTGTTRSASFPITSGAYDIGLSGVSDGFVAKFATSGQLSISTFIGGNGFESPHGIGIGAMGRILVAGETASADFPTSSTGRPPDGFDGFVTALAPDGGSIAHSRLVGGAIRESGGTFDTVRGVVSAPDGSTYLAGATVSVNFPTTVGGIDPVTDPGVNALLVHLDGSGLAVLSSTVFGGRLAETAEGITRAPDGDVIVAGSTTSDDFPTTPGSVDSTFNSPGFNDAFVVRLSPDCAVLRYGTYLGGAETDYGTSVTVDSTGAAFVTGTTTSVDYPTTPGAFDTVQSVDNPDAYVSRLDSTGSTLLYSTFVGGSFSEDGTAIAVDGLNRATVTGTTNSVDFPTTPGAYSTVHNGQVDLFVTKLEESGATAVFSTFLGGAGGEQVGGIVIDSDGNVVVSGATNSTNYPTSPGAFDTTFNGVADGFVTGLNATGSQLAFSTFYGGSGVDVCTALARDSLGNLWACGWSQSVNLPLTSNAYDSTAGGSQDAFVVSFNAAASSMAYATLLGGPDNDIFYGLSIDSNGAVTLVGLLTTLGLAPSGIGTDDGNSGLFVRLVRAADTPALYVPSSGAWFPRFVNASGPANLVFTYGAGGSGLVPLAGNWDGTGGDSPGLYDPSTGAFFLRNSNSPGPADIVFTFGPGGSDFVPLAGDWNGDGTDTIGIYSLSTGAFFLRNANVGGAADLVFTFGPGGAGFTPVAGDWNGDGTETIGIYQTASGAFFLRNANSSGGADLVFTFGSGGAGVVPVSGDWNGDGTDTVGVVLQSSGFYFLRDSNSAGPANYAFGYGAGGETPVVGNWAG